MRRIIFRAILLTLGVAYVVLVIWNYHAQWLLDRPTPENLSRGVHRHPGNPALWSAYASYWLTENPERARDAYLRAAAINPLQPANWDGLATAYLQLGEQDKAEAALRASLAARPNSPRAAWRLANFLVLRGQQPEATPYLRVAAATDPTLRPAVFDLGWKILDSPAAILRDLVPPILEARIDYLHFLMERKKLAEGYEVWGAIRSSHADSGLETGYAYLDALAAAAMGPEAARVWAEILEDTGRAGAKPPGELVTNGDFEFDLINAGLDWRLGPSPGFEIALDNFVLQHGSRSLRVTFDGTANPDFRHVWQLVPVEPNRGYRFRGYIKTQNVSTDNGLQFCVSAYAAPPADAFERCSKNRVGDDPWSLEQIDFRTGAGTRIVRIDLRRQKSMKFNNLLQGKVWIDDLSVQPLAK